MEKTVKDLSVAELKAVLSEAVREAVQDEIEELNALSSNSYIASIAEARADHASGYTKTFKELFPDV